jgi:hypothetical protein
MLDHGGARLAPSLFALVAVLDRGAIASVSPRSSSGAISQPVVPSSTIAAGTDRADRDRRQAAGHAFDQHEAELLPIGGEHDRVGGVEQGRQLVVLLPAGEEYIRLAVYEGSRIVIALRRSDRPGGGSGSVPSKGQDALAVRAPSGLRPKASLGRSRRCCAA